MGEAPPSVTKTVRFNCAMVKKTLSWKEMTPEEIATTWYTAEEQTEIRTQCRDLARHYTQQQHGDDEDDNEDAAILCYRGLESYLPHTAQRKRMHRCEATILVLEEQNYQDCQYEDYPHSAHIHDQIATSIAEAYQTYSIECQFQAELRALQDHNDVVKIVQQDAREAAAATAAHHEQHNSDEEYDDNFFVIASSSPALSQSSAASSTTKEPKKPSSKKKKKKTKEKYSNEEKRKSVENLIKSSAMKEPKTPSSKKQKKKKEQRRPSSSSTTPAHHTEPTTPNHAASAPAAALDTSTVALLFDLMNGTSLHKAARTPTAFGGTAQTGTAAPPTVETSFINSTGGRKKVAVVPVHKKQAHPVSPIQSIPQSISPSNITPAAA